MNLIEAMTVIADKYHNKIVGQVRKYTGEPYTVHTDAVERIYASIAPDDIAGRAAAKGHDLLEDTPITLDLLREELRTLGVDMADPAVEESIGLIVELTDVYVREKFPKTNRAERKKLERERLSKISVKGQSIKLSDLINNTESIVEYDKDFARVYLKEKMALLGELTNGNPELLQRATIQAYDGYKKLGLTLPMLSSNA